MAACGAMTLKIGVLVTALMLLVAGCTKMVDGRGVVAVPPPGSPIVWGECENSASDGEPAPAGAECGMLSVPVDYAKPDGEVAQLAMIRFKATGDKIGSLIINPGGPGESGVEAAASMLGTLPDDVRERFDLVGFDPRGVADLHARGVVQLRRRQRSAARRPAGRLHPGGCRAHREGNQGVRPALCRQDGRRVPGQRRNRQRRQGSGRDARGPRRREADLSGLLVRHPDRGVCTRRPIRTRCGR